MIEHLRVDTAVNAAMKREVVASRGEIGVVGIGSPYDAHAEDA
jgi:hypothetical protein